MKVTLQIPDELADQYEQYQAAFSAAARKPISLTEILAKQLDLYKDVSPTDRIIVVRSKQRSRLEVLLAGGTLRDDVDLVKKVESLSKVKISGIDINFTEGQLNQIKSYAARNRVTPEEAITRVVRQMESQFFDYVAGGY